MRYSAAITRFFCFTLILFLFVCPNVSSQPADVETEESTPDTLYIVPFLNVMVPGTFSSQLFDTFVDRVLLLADPFDIRIRILKQGIDGVDADWLAQQHYATGELFGYFEESGCCSTEIEAKVRAYYHVPGAVEPVGNVIVPDDTFFDHDLTTLERERTVLATSMGQELAELFMYDLVIEP